MKFEPLPLSGACEIDIERRGDDRGFFARFFCTETFAGQGLNTNWVQMNLSFSAACGTLRGLHFQRPPHAEVKLIRALSGQAHDVIVDLRAGSATYGQHCAVRLCSQRRNAIYVPAGFAHGFQTLSDDVELQYFHSAAHAPESEGGVHALDPALGIAWPLPPRQMSPRDQALAPLAACDPITP